MLPNPYKGSAGSVMVCLSILLNAIVLRAGLITGGTGYRLLPVTATLLLASLIALLWKKQ
ncbi:hypothetical protein [uncultured Chitinophaga sp.]|jgi:hypothetical protein|uniref:hypothetical protein n=1 Tax=uncultured Chitinophaga sp. TaxID=339340 RepID=UPI0026369B4F|nr:hypothetical protein [uncultured Chitinophaga sp.]